MSVVLSEQEKAIVRALQQDLPLVPEPYRAVADDLGISEEALLESVDCRKKAALNASPSLCVIKTLAIKSTSCLFGTSLKTPSPPLVQASAAIPLSPIATNAIAGRTSPIIFIPWCTPKATTNTHAFSMSFAPWCVPSWAMMCRMKDCAAYANSKRSA